MKDYKRVAEVDLKVNSKAAEEKLDKLQTKAKDLREKFADAFRKGDTKGIDKYNSELKKVNKEIEVMCTNASNIRAAMVRLDKATPKELQRTIKMINTELNSGRVVRGSKEWDLYIEKLKQVKDELRSVQGEHKETESFMSRFAGKFTKWWGTYTILTDAIGGVQMKLSQMKQNYRDKGESAANLKALTGLDDDSISWLTKQAETLSTAMDESGLRITQSSKEILDAYMLVGSNKPELLSAKEELNSVTIEAMRLASAAKMKLNPAVDAMTTALNQYGEGADQAARYVNVLAAGSKFGAANVEQQAAAILKSGTAAASANVPIEELVGSIEMLGEKGIKGEIAGTGLKKFFLVLQTGAKETNPKVVGLSTALENLKAAVDAAEKKTVGGGAAFLKKMFGEEAFSIASILADNTAKVKEYTEAVTGTQTAMEQAAINSDTDAAKMAQMRNKIEEAGNALIEKLNPSLGVLVSWSSKLIGVLPGLIDGLIACKGTILTLVAAYAVYNAYQVRTIALRKLKVFWHRKVIASCRQAYATIVKHPYGVVIAAAALLVGILIDVVRAHNRVGEAQKALNDIKKGAIERMSDERVKLDLLVAAARNEKLSLDQRQAAIDKLNQIIPNYNAALDATTGKYTENKVALDEYIKSLTRKYEIEGAKEKLAELGKEKADLIYKRGRTQAKLDSELTKEYNKRVNATLYDGALGESEDFFDKKDFDGFVIRTLRKKIANLDKKIENKSKALDIIAGTYAEDLQKDAIKDANPDPDPPDPPQPKGTPVAVEDEKERKKAAAAAKKALEDEMKNQKAARDLLLSENQAAYNDDRVNYDEYVRTKEKIHMDYFAKVKELLKEKGLTETAYYADIAKQEEEYRSASLKRVKDNELKELKSSYDSQQAQNLAARSAGLKDYLEYTADKERIDRDYISAQKKVYESRGLTETAEYAALLKKEEEMRAKAIEKRRKLSLEGVEDEHAWKVDSITERYFDPGDSIFQNKKAYDEALLEEDLRYLRERRDLFEQHSPEWQQVNKQINDRVAQDQLDKQKETADAYLAFEQEYRKLSGSQREKLELDMLAELHRQGLLSEEEYQRAVGKIKDKYRKDDQQKAMQTQSEYTDMILGLYNSFDALFKDLGETGKDFWDRLADAAAASFAVMGAMMSQYSAYANAERDLEISKIEKRYDREIAAAGKNSKKKERLEKQKEDAIAKVKKKHNDKAMKIELAQAVAQTALAAIAAYASGSKVNVWLGPVAAAMATAAGMLQIAAIKKQHEAQAAGYYDGGFTRRDPDDRREVGVVHANEFVANHKAVSNPALSPILRLIDHAQRNNTVGSLTADDVSVALGRGGGVSPRGEGSGVPFDPSGLTIAAGDMAASAQRANAAIDRLNANLEDGIEAVVILDGERGFHKRYTDFQKLIKNPKR